MRRPPTTAGPASLRTLKVLSPKPQQFELPCPPLSIPPADSYPTPAQAQGAQPNYQLYIMPTITNIGPTDLALDGLVRPGPGRPVSGCSTLTLFRHIVF